MEKQPPCPECAGQPGHHNSWCPVGLIDALTQIRDYRIKQLQQTCPDCEELYGNKCDHGADHDFILKMCRLGLQEE